MLFNSYAFIFAFFPLSILGRFLLGAAGKYMFGNLLLLLMSLFFYAYFNISYLPLILYSILINYGVHRFLCYANKKWARKLALVLAIVFNLGILFYYKYADFFAENINVLFQTDYPLKHLLLPLGISFFTFQQLGFVIDSYKKETKQYSFLNYALFVSYYPQLIAGPIVTYEELIPQLEDTSRQRVNWENVALGLYVFVLGLAKKVLIADLFGSVVNWGYASIESLNAINAVLVILGYTIQIYFDFSGYCDMATGIAKMMNIDLPQNFYSPYKATTITEFWNRWHMTLTRFFTRYLYIPMGGNRKGMLRMCLHTMVVFMVSGLWHGANWTFVLWGTIHGALVVLTKLLKPFVSKVPKFVRWSITFIFINATWVFFRADSIAQAFEMFARLTSSTGVAGFPFVYENTFLPLIRFVIIHILMIDHGYLSRVVLPGYVLVTLVMLFGRNTSEMTESRHLNCWQMILTSVLLVMCICSFSGLSTFLYFNF